MDATRETGRKVPVSFSICESGTDLSGFWLSIVDVNQKQLFDSPIGRRSRCDRRNQRYFDRTNGRWSQRSSSPSRIFFLERRLTKSQGRCPFQTRCLLFSVEDDCERVLDVPPHQNAFVVAALPPQVWTIHQTTVSATNNLGHRCKESTRALRGDRGVYSCLLGSPTKTSRLKQMMTIRNETLALEFHGFTILYEGASNFRRQMEIYQTTLGGEHESVALVLNHLGEVARFQDKLFEAIFLVRDNHHLERTIRPS